MQPFNALMPGEHDWMKGKPMPGQAAQPSVQPKRNPVMNALSTVFEYGAPEAYEAGRQKKITRELGNRLAGGDVAGAGQYALQQGNLDQGMQLQGMAGEQDAARRKQEAQGVVTLFSQGPQFVNQYAMEDPAGFESQTGMTADEYLQAAGRFGDGGQQFAQFAMQKAQAELGQAPSAPEYGAPVEALGPDGKPAYVQWSKTGQAKPMEGYTPPGAQAKYVFEEVEGNIVAINPADPADRVVVGKAPVKTPLVTNNVNMPDQKGETKFQEGLGTNAAAGFQTIIDQGRAAGASIGNLDTMESLLDSIDYTGFGGDTLLTVQRAGAMLGIEIPDLPAKEAAKRLSSQMALSLKSDLPGPMSNADREFLLSIPPNLNSSAAGNDAIIFILRKREERKQDMMQSLLQADPQSMEEYRAWENRYLQETPPMFTPATQASLLRALGSAGAETPQ